MSQFADYRDAIQDELAKIIALDDAGDCRNPSHVKARLKTALHYVRFARRHAEGITPNSTAPILREANRRARIHTILGAIVDGAIKALRCHSCQGWIRTDGTCDCESVVD